MSMNITLHDRKTKDRFSLFQTPTEVTHNILAKRDRYQAYVRWFRESRDWNWKSPNDVGLYKGHKQELRRWLEAHPDHVWGLI